MTIEITEIEYCKIQVKYEAEPDIISKKRNEVIDKFKSRKVPGFRDGHATIAAIKQHYRKQIGEVLKQELTDEAVQNAMFEKNLKPLGRPTLSYANLDESLLVGINGESALPKFTCEFSMNVQPEFELGAYKDFEIPKPAASIPEEELSQRILQDLRVKNGHTTPYEQDDFVQMGDTVIIDYTGSIDGNQIEDLTKTGDMLNIGRINIPGFSESLLGMKPEDTREFDLNLPEDHKDYPGKTIHMNVKLTMGSKTIPAALDDELAKQIGLENFDKLLEGVKSMATTRIKELETNQIMDQITNRLVENHQFRIPTWISMMEAEINVRNSGHEWKTIPDVEKEKFVDMAEKSIKLSLILQKVRDNEPDATLSDEETFSVAKQNISQFSQEPEKLLAEMVKNGHIYILLNRIRDQYALEFIQKTCKLLE
jgi:trigger factor